NQQAIKWLSEEKNAKYPYVASNTIQIISYKETVDSNKSDIYHITNHDNSGPKTVS
ncbi:hypothetical protein LDENG_00258030, partial [Lucifuga dentata]